jgi:hypothetical protein
VAENRLELERGPRRTVAEEGGPSRDLFSAPTLGHFFDLKTRGVRPILGTPGASSVGDVVHPGLSLSRAWVSPRQDFALGEREGDRDLWLIGLESQPVTVTVLTGIGSGSDRVAMSPTGSAAALYFRSRHSILIISGRPVLPKVGPEIPLWSFSGAPSSLAVSDDGQLVLASAARQNGGGVFVLQPGTEPRLVVSAGEIHAMTFLRNSRDAVVADSAANELRLLNDVTGGAASQVLAGETDGILQPVTVEPSEDNQRVFVLNSGSSTVSTVDLAARTVSQLRIPGTVVGLSRLRGDVFQLTGSSMEPSLLLDATNVEPRVVFVPLTGKVDLRSRRAERTPSGQLRTMPRTK